MLLMNYHLGFKLPELYVLLQQEYFVSPFGFPDFINIVVSAGASIIILVSYMPGYDCFSQICHLYLTWLCLLYHHNTLMLL